MKKALTLIAILCMAAMLFAGCGLFPLPSEPTEPPVTEEPTTPACEHNWVDATCTAAKTCSKCGTTEGTPSGHTPGAEATCTEAQVCTVCNAVLVAAKGHTPGEDDGDCTTAISCTVCGQEAVAAKDAHVAAEDDGDCTTAVKCANCDKEVVAAQDAHEAGEDDGNCTTAVECVNCDKEAVAAKEAHIPAEDDGDVTTAVKCQSCDHICVEEKEAINLTIGTFENGAVVTDKKNYAVGEKVTLTITPADGYAQKLSINGEPLLLGWKTNVYTFVAEEGKSYAITGSFEKIDLGGQKYAENWDYSNIANGHIGIYYPNSNESSWKTFTDKNNSYTVVLKDYSNGAETAANNTEGFIFRIEFTINGKAYQFRVIKQNGVYKFQKITDGYDTVQFDEAATNAILGDGVEFKAERVTGNMLAFSINGKLVYTYTVEGATAAHEVTKFCMWHSNNQGHYIDLPIKAEKVAVKDSIVSVVKGNWDLTKQNDGIVTILNKTSDGAAIKTVDATYTEASVSVVDYLTDVNELSVQFKFYFDTGKYYEVRLHETNGLNLYRIQNMGNSNNLGGNDWTKHYELTAEQITKIRSEGVKFTVKLVDGNAELYVDDVKVATVTLGADYVGKTAQIELCVNGNKTGSDIVIPFEVK